MSHTDKDCPDCKSSGSYLGMDRRQFIRVSGTGVAALTIGSLPRLVVAENSNVIPPSPESAVKDLYESLSEQQRSQICFDWNYVDPEKGLLRTRVGNNWSITPHMLNDEFFTDEQRDIVRVVYEGIVHSEWHDKFDQQLKDDADGYGQSQSIAIFGEPGDGKFEFVMTGRHMTMRCDGNSANHVAFGGPIFYGHDPGGVFYEEKEHKGNVFWEQAVEANHVYEMLDGRQRKLAEVANSPEEKEVGFQSAAGKRPGISVSDLSSDQREQVQKTLQKLIAPYRQSDQDEVIQCLQAQGGLDQCNLAFYTDADTGEDRVWDNWRLEGPAFVWYFRGAPHVHVWVNVADNSSVSLNS